MRVLAANLLLLALKWVSAAPTPIPTPEPLFGINIGTGETDDSNPIPVPDEDITSQLVRSALFARAVYCSSPVVETWSCGEPCDALGSNIKVLVAGGDDGKVPNFFVAYDQDEDTVVVAHQGTDPSNLLSDLNDINFFQVGANTTVLPGAGGTYTWSGLFSVPFLVCPSVTC